MVLVALSIQSCSQDKASIKKEMIELDRVYIPTLMYTRQEDTNKSREAITKLQIIWEKFNSNNSRDYPDSAWRNTFVHVGGLFARADGLLNTSNDFKAAHEALEEVSVILGEMRTSYELKLFSDYLTDFRRPMEAIVLSVKGLNAETLTDSTVLSLQAITTEAQALWAIVDTLSLDTTLYEVTTIEHKRLKKWIVEESALLKELNEALHADDKSEVIRLALQIKLLFAKTYTFFGGFAGAEVESAH